MANTQCLPLVLSLTKEDVRDKKGKDSEINKWEDELRKSLADKKAKAAKTSTLTKQQQALVQAQVAKESQIRAKVNDVHFKLIRGLYLVRSLIETSVDELRMYVSPISTLLLDGALAKGYLLVGELAFETYLVCRFKWCQLKRWLTRDYHSALLNVAQRDWIHFASGSE